MLRSLVGSEMCIRDRSVVGHSSKSGVAVDKLYKHADMIARMFVYFDKDCDGMLSSSEWNQGCDWLNSQLAPEDAIMEQQELFTVLDHDQSGTIDLNEFMEAFRITDADPE
eukprot:TRINITY_DN36995_c0_g1_i1.p1 TRINITY_DN36995_c0_g1~~TRINITY_DN36995_c0_g1_i1.p1  ORF type:complete len:111 (-),score=39.62 TRINITY_DN36995_c0_g1_i1:434-766(-)